MTLYLARLSTVLAACAWTVTVHGGALKEVACRPPLAARLTQNDKAASEWIPKAFDVAVRGRYTQPFPGDVTVPATKITLKNLGLVPGDYVGLRAEGQYFTWKNEPRPFQALGAVFFANTKMVSPGNFGQETPFSFYDSSDNKPYGVNEFDFNVPADREIIVRIPKNATAIAFSVPDWFVSDNCPPRVTGPNGYDCPSTGFSVVVYEPNKPGKKMAPVSGYTDEEGDAIAELALNKIDVAGVPEAKFFSASPFSGTVTSVTDAQWRGAYSDWSPGKSQYGADRGEGRRHWGWDLFAPAGSKLVAPVWPSQMTVPPHSDSFGDSVVFSFSYKGQVYHIAYSHLKDVIGVPRYISGLEEVAFAGCSGNASQAGCGSAYPNGTRNDHVHVGLFQRAAQPIDTNACDPGGLLKWNIR